jgi:hypothetical protein
MVVSSEQTNGVASERSMVGEALPKAMGPQDMARAFGISVPTFYRQQREGVYKRFELPVRLRPKCKRYSGEKVQSFFNGRK